MEFTSFYRNGGQIDVVRDSITRYPADAVVCPTNTGADSVFFEGSVQSAFRKDAGEGIFAKAKERAQESGFHHDANGLIALLTPGSAVISEGSGKIPAKYVFHSCSMGIDEENKPYCDTNIVGKSVDQVLALADIRQDVFSVGFPALGTGLYGLCLEDCLDTMFGCFSTQFDKRWNSIKRLGVVIPSSDDYKNALRVAGRHYGEGW